MDLKWDESSISARFKKSAARFAPRASLLMGQAELACELRIFFYYFFVEIVCYFSQLDES